MTNKTKSASAVVCSEFRHSGRIVPSLLLSVSLVFTAAAGADSMMKDSAMKAGEGMMEKMDMQGEKGMMKDDKGMMEEGKTMMKDEKGMMEEGKTMMKDEKGMMGEGKAMMTNRNGRFEITQTEKAEFRLGGVVLEIHGMGFSGDSPEPVFEALGIILYDARTNKHVFRAIHKTGQFIDTEIEWLGPKKFQWIIDVKSGKRRHIMELINGQWVEYGEMLTPKGAWFKFFEMKLDRKE